MRIEHRPSLLVPLPLSPVNVALLVQTPSSRNTNILLSPRKGKEKKKEKEREKKRARKGKERRGKERGKNEKRKEEEGKERNAQWRVNC